MDVTYARFQDDIVILCKSKRQLNRSRQRMMKVLQERKLKLSRKKSRVGCISKGFHFLGIDYYPGAQTSDNTSAAPSVEVTISTPTSVRILTGGGVNAMQTMTLNRVGQRA